ncbi:cupredoxin domain-containing protein [Halomonas faecis]|uniref:cupredoxin domain-containing protein n=1 Tax=Halomonas faecis TaxID=1562110 RepID=UPI0013D14637|nr:plastocyanin/azurin family copper-binding protein [Halomonas faecis]
MRNSLLPLLMGGLLSSTVAFAAGEHDDGHHASHDATAERTIRFQAGDMWFDPERLEIAPGETVRFEIVNTGNVEHEFVIGDAEAQAAHRQMMQEMASGGHGSHGAHDDDLPAVTIAPGETATLVWTAPEDVRDLEFACNIPGHYEAGMSGDIDVEG